MAFHFKLEIDGKVYEKKRLSLGEIRTLKRLFGIEGFGDLLDLTDPDVAIGLLYLCRLDEQPGADPARILEEIESIEIESFAAALNQDAAKRTEEKQDQEGERPTDPGGEEKPPAPSRSATTRKTSGSRS